MRHLKHGAGFGLFCLVVFALTYEELRHESVGLTGPSMASVGVLAVLWGLAILWLSAFLGAKPIRRSMISVL